jgi:hypothetical protein
VDRRYKRLFGFDRFSTFSDFVSALNVESTVADITAIGFSAFLTEYASSATKGI